MLDYSYWALCSAGIITIISYSTGREKYKTTREWPTEKKKKINRPITLLYVAEQPQKWELRLIFAQSSSGRHRRVQQFKSSSDDWRHGLNLMANQLPKQSWLHEFCTKRNLSRGRSWKTCWWTWTLIWWGWSQGGKRARGRKVSPVIEDFLT